jgi:hypothetical protein
MATSVQPLEDRYDLELELRKMELEMELAFVKCSIEIRDEIKGFPKIMEQYGYAAFKTYADDDPNQPVNIALLYKTYKAERDLMRKKIAELLNDSTTQPYKSVAERYTEYCASRDRVIAELALEKIGSQEIK